MAYEEILLVTADLKISFQLRRMAEGFGLVVTEANSIPVVLDVLKNFSPHAMLVDVDLPRAEVRHFLSRKSAIFSLNGVPYGLMGKKASLTEVRPGEMGIEAPAATIPLPLDHKVAGFSLRKLLKEAAKQKLIFKGTHYSELVLAASFPAVGVSFDEAGFSFRSPVRFQKGDVLNGLLTSELMNKVGLGQAQWVVQSSQMAGGSYLTTVNFFGVTTDIAKNIRNHVGVPT